LFFVLNDLLISSSTFLSESKYVLFLKKYSSCVSFGMFVLNFVVFVLKNSLELDVSLFSYVLFLYFYWSCDLLSFLISFLIFWSCYNSLKLIWCPLTFVALVSWLLSDFLKYWCISCNIFSMLETLVEILVCFLAELGDLVFRYFSEIRESSFSLIDFLDSIDLLRFSALFTFFGVKDRLYFLIVSFPSR